MTRGHARPPDSPKIPPQPPALRAGICTSHPDPDLWTSPVTTAHAEAALSLCRSCPALDPCRAWSLSIRTADDLDVILGGLMAKDRALIRRARQRALKRATAPASDASAA
jgi:hypothetical protein